MISLLPAVVDRLPVASLLESQQSEVKVCRGNCPSRRHGSGASQEISLRTVDTGLEAEWALPPSFRLLLPTSAVWLWTRSLSSLGLCLMPLNEG